MADLKELKGRKQLTTFSFTPLIQAWPRFAAKIWPWVYVHSQQRQRRWAWSNYHIVLATLLSHTNTTILLGLIFPFSLAMITETCLLHWGFVCLLTNGKPCYAFHDVLREIKKNQGKSSSLCMVVVFILILIHILLHQSLQIISVWW